MSVRAAGAVGERHDPDGELHDPERQRLVNRTPQPDATFAGAFSISRVPADDWFDPKLHVDTDLFVDPFLMFDLADARWSTVHSRLIKFFNEVLLHVARAGQNQQSTDWLRAATMLSFPEPAAFCLGYAKKGIHGAGSSSGLGTAMLHTAREAVLAGIRNIDDFGELMLFGEHFGADRISDMVCNIVMDLFIGYTTNVVQRHNVPTETFTLNHVGYDFARSRWSKRKVELPRNPCWSEPTPVILVPESVLDELPKMDDQSFWDWAFDNENEQLRKELGMNITEHLDRKTIISEARRRPYLVRRLGRSYAGRLRNHPPKPYDFSQDPSFKVKPFATAQSYTADAANRLPRIEKEEDFGDFVLALVTDFKWAVEDRGLFNNFWSGDHPYREDQAQDLFHLSVLQICKAVDVDVSPETDAGRGPVDFKFSRGWQRRALVELKFAKSSSFWDNLEQQPKTYTQAEGADFAIMGVLLHEDRHCTDEFKQRVQGIVSKVATEFQLDYRVVFIDVRRKPSASKLKKAKPEIEGSNDSPPE